VLIEEGLLAEQCGAVLTDFFALRRRSEPSSAVR
jgi:hypothetical protein